MKYPTRGVVFFMYKGYLHAFDDFVVVPPNSELEKDGWEAYHSDTFFSGVVLKTQDDDVIAATFISS